MTTFADVSYPLGRSIRLLVLLAALSLLGCASVGTNTPQQDYTFEIGKRCETAATKLERVSADGSRYWIQARGDAGIASSEYPKFFACMKDQFKTYSYLDWLKAQKREGSQPPVAVGYAEPATALPAGPIAAPVWQVGDEWQYAYKGPSDSGTFVWSVGRVEPIEGVSHYVIRWGGTREIFYRVSDLALSLERVDGVVQRRETPSRLIYAWPLTPGKTWEQSNREERPIDRQTTDRNSVWTVEAEETVTVPAGSFRTVKITWRNKNTGAINYEMWYAPEVKQWVKIREALTNSVRERELIAFRLR